jgi:hypothetical protein
MAGETVSGEDVLKTEARLKEIYDYSIKNLEINIDRKHHFEIKSLYILQATAILVTLFVGFKDKITDNLSNVQLANYIFIRNLFYLAILITLITLLLSLFDAIFGKFEDIQDPKVLYYEYPIKTTLKEYYEEQVKLFSISINSSKKILGKRIIFYNIGLISFIFSVVLLILIGFVFV